MSTMKGLRADDLFWERLYETKDRFRGTVHSVFSSTMNIQEEEGTLWTLSVERDLYLPGTLEISGEISFDSYRELLGKPVRVSAYTLFAGTKLQVDLRSLRKRKPRKKPLAVTGTGNPEDMVRETVELLKKHGKRGGCLSFFLPGPAEDFIEKALQDRILQLETTGDFQRILGLGRGLTPSGDDFSLGFLSMASYLEGEKLKEYQKALCGIIEEGSISTTEVSLQMLRFGKEGRFSGELTEFCESVLRGESTENRQNSMLKLLNIGSISGTDMATGALFALQMHQKQQCGGNDDKKNRA